MFIEVSIGEIIDKCTILEIKLKEIQDKQKLAFIKKEYDYLSSILTSNLGITLDSDIYLDLKKINKVIWDLEDKIRQKEKLNLFDDEFIFLSRSIHRNNEYRANLKREINVKFQSDFIEVKSYN